MFVMAHLSRWLDGEGLDAAGLTPQVADRFLAARRAAGVHACCLSPKALAPLLGYLRAAGRGPDAGACPGDAGRRSCWSAIGATWSPSAA